MNLVALGEFLAPCSASTSSGGNCYTRQLATSAALLAVGAVGTVTLYKLTTSSKRFDGYSLSSYFSELLQQISPCKWPRVALSILSMIIN